MQSVITHLFQRRRIWVPTKLGCLIISLVTIAITATFFLQVYPFLAENSPIESELLIVEGAFPSYAIDDLIKEYKLNNYQKMILVSGPIGYGQTWSGFEYYSEMLAATLVRKGVVESELIVLTRPQVVVNRTYSNAVTTSNWLIDNPYETCNLYSIGAHARRSKLLFQLALDRTRVGVLAYANPQFNSSNWWRSSMGFRSTISELLAYLYAKLFFYP